MTATALALARPARASDSLGSVVDLRELVARGLDVESWRFAPAPDDPVFGYSICQRTGCERGTTYPGDQLCRPCSSARQRADEPLEVFLASPPSRAGDRLCLVCRTPGHERPARLSGLCTSCDSARQRDDLTVEAFVAGVPGRHAPAKPRRTFGRCEVGTCERFAQGRNGLCNAHTTMWWRRGRIVRSRYDELSWRPTTGRVVELRLLRARVRDQVLAGMGFYARSGKPISPYDLECLVATAAAADDLAQVHIHSQSASARLVRWCLRVEALAGRRIEDERRQDVWDLGVIDPTSTAKIDFTAIPQRWLRDVTKHLVFDQLATRHMETISRYLRGAEELGRSLASRADGGDRPAALARSDIEGFLLRLGRRRKSGELTERRHQALVISARIVLEHAREAELFATGGPAQGLAAAFRFRDGDVPRLARHDPDEPGKALPESVIAQLISPDNLQRLGDRHEAARDVVLLLIHTGRRPGEILRLTCDCLVWEPHGDGSGPPTPVLRYRREKPPRKQLSLPIHTTTARLIQDVIDRRRAQFPATPPHRLMLFGATYANRAGDKPLPASTIKGVIDRWRDTLPQLIGVDGRPFDRDQIYPYAFRHSYAQRHADAGVRQDVLQRLMDHRSADTTAGYYRIGQDKKRAALEIVGPLTIGRDGDRVHSALGRYLESEDLRREIGTVPVPLGHCVEPRNVRAFGRSCEFRYRCLGCAHFRTDPSRLDDLRAYLDELLKSRELLAATAPELADWARADAMPSDQEIRQVRDLIRRSEQLLDELDDQDRRTIEDYLRELRGRRALLQDALPIEHVGGVSTPNAVIVPPPTTENPHA